MLVAGSLRGILDAALLAALPRQWMEKIVREDQKLLLLHARTALEAGHRVSVGRSGVAELIEIDNIAVVPDSDLIIIQPSVARAGHPQLWAAGQLAAVEIVETASDNSPTANYLPS